MKAKVGLKMIKLVSKNLLKYSLLKFNFKIILNMPYLIILLFNWGPRQKSVDPIIKMGNIAIHILYHSA